MTRCYLSLHYKISLSKPNAESNPRQLSEKNNNNKTEKTGREVETQTGTGSEQNKESEKPSKENYFMPSSSFSGSLAIFKRPYLLTEP
ncbi:hypothetical protein LWI28_021009 [Acer negundo]|uniref:Uncharacterized protein n=1 Tax=Acer negundo TaxID=4023 RepID=A0AAD5IB61_ACENE|nr:hypothetical protein LWI28_021009 [Acer negundo]